MPINPQDIPRGLDTGSELVSALFAVALWGTTCVQTLFYFIHFSHDTFVLKALVIWLWVVDTAHQLLLVQGIYNALIVNFCNYEQVLRVRPEYLWQILLTTFVALPSQLFFIDRIRKFSGNRWLFFALWVPAATFQMAGGLAFIAFGTIKPTAQELVSSAPSGIFTAVQTTASVVDISITSGLVYLLWRSREDAQYKMRTIVHRLLVLSLSTGMWTALFAIFTVITMLVFRNTLLYAGLYFPLCPLYCNTVLANLNARRVVVRGHDPSDNAITFLRESGSSDPTAIPGRSVAQAHEPQEWSQISSRRPLSASLGQVSERGMQTFSEIEARLVTLG